MSRPIDITEFSQVSTDALVDSVLDVLAGVCVHCARPELGESGRWCRSCEIGIEAETTPPHPRRIKEIQA